MLAGQCLDRRLADQPTLKREVAAWKASRNRAGRAEPDTPLPGARWRGRNRPVPASKPAPGSRSRHPRRHRSAAGSPPGSSARTSYRRCPRAQSRCSRSRCESASGPGRGAPAPLHGPRCRTCPTAPERRAGRNDRQLARTSPVRSCRRRSGGARRRRRPWRRRGKANAGWKHRSSGSRMNSTTDDALIEAGRRPVVTCREPSGSAHEAVGTGASHTGNSIESSREPRDVTLQQLCDSSSRTHEPSP